MPWPPTYDTDFDISVPLEAQLSSGVPAGLSPDIAVGTESATSGVDAATGTMAPGSLGMYDNPLDLIEELEKRHAQQRKDQETDAKGRRAKVIEFAREKLGMKYVWGGESDAEGGYDCSGLLWYAFKKAGIDMPRVSMAQAERGKRVGVNKLQAGDLVAWENNSRQAGADHIALYLGDGMILEAPRTGLNIRIRKLRANEGAWGVQLDY